jgi:hypothetical protein
MGIGTASETLQLDGVSPADAFEKALRAMSAIGKVTESDVSEGFVRGTTRYGFQKVRLKVHVRPQDAGSVVGVKALADDVWGKGARSGMMRFRDALVRTS